MLTAMVSGKSVSQAEQHQRSIDYSKYSEWDRSQAMVRFEPISSTCANRICDYSSRRSLESSYVGCDQSASRYESGNHRKNSRRSSKHRRRSSSRQTCACELRYGQQSQPSRHRSRHYIPVEQHRHRDLSRVATARQSSFSVLSQSSAAILSDQQRRRRLTSKSDEVDAQNVSVLKTALSKVGKRSQVQVDRKSLLRRSAVIELSQDRTSKRSSESNNNEHSNAAENVASRAPSSCEVNNEPQKQISSVLSGIGHQQPRISFLLSEKERFLVLRQTCLEIYANESAYNKGIAKSCILLVGAKLRVLNGGKFRIDSCNKSRIFRMASEDEHHQWTQELERTILQLASKA